MKGKSMLEAIFTENVLTITLTGLYQWDYGQKLYIKGLELGETEQIHFSNTKEKEAIVMPLVKHGEQYICDIPNVLLEKWWDITAWVYDVGENSGETIRTVILKVEPRVKPQDFISTNPDANDILSDVLNKIDQNIKDNEQFKTEITVILKVEPRVKPQDFISTNPDANDILSDVLNKIDQNIKDNEQFKTEIKFDQEQFQSEIEAFLKDNNKLSVSSYLSEAEIDEIMKGTYVEQGGDEPSQSVTGEPIDLPTLNDIFK